MLVAIAVVAIWAETFVSSKILLDKGLFPADIFFYRFVIAYVLIWMISPKKLWSGSFKDELVMFFLGVFGGSLYFLAENTAIQYSTASNVAIIVSSAPLMTACLVAIFYREERMTGSQLLGSLVAFVGMTLVVLNGQKVLHLNPVGDMLALGASLTWALYSLLIKKVSDKYDIRFITRKVFGYGLITIIPHYLLVSPLKWDTDILSQPAVWGNLVYLGVVASMLCFVCWNWALKKIGTVRTTNLIYCQSFFTMIIAKIILGDRITWMAIIGTIILIYGMSKAVKR